MLGYEINGRIADAYRSMYTDGGRIDEDDSDAAEALADDGTEPQGEEERPRSYGWVKDLDPSVGFDWGEFGKSLGRHSAEWVRGLGKGVSKVGRVFGGKGMWDRWDRKVDRISDTAKEAYSSDWGKDFDRDTGAGETFVRGVGEVTPAAAALKPALQATRAYKLASNPWVRAGGKAADAVGWNVIGNRFAKRFDDEGRPIAANIARAAGMLGGGVSAAGMSKAFAKTAVPKTAEQVARWGLPGSLGATVAAEKAAHELADRGIIGQDRADAITGVSDVAAYGGLGATIGSGVETAFKEAPRDTDDFQAQPEDVDAMLRAEVERVEADRRRRGEPIFVTDGNGGGRWLKPGDSGYAPDGGAVANPAQGGAGKESDDEEETEEWSFLPDKTSASR